MGLQFWQQQSKLNSLFLDLYPGAVCGHSMSQLKAIPVTPAIRVRNASTGVEADIGFSGGGLDIAALTAHLAGAVGTVPKIYHQDGTGNDFSQPVVINQPHITDLSGNILYDNGKPTISFNIAALNKFFNLPTGLLNGATNLSYFHVMKIKDTGGLNTGIFGPATTGGVGFEVLQHSVVTRPTLLRINGVRRNDNAAAAYQLWNDDAQCMTSIIGTPSAVAAWRNSTGVTLTNAGAMPALNFNGVYSLGRYAISQYMTGKWQETIVYATDQTANMAAIQAHRNGYYNIAGF